MEPEEKIIEKIRKLLALESGNALNEETRNEAFSAGQMARKLLQKYKLDHKDIAQVQTFEPTYIPPVMGRTIFVNPFLRAGAKQNLRWIWFEKLAETVAESYFCKTRVENNNVVFYGLDMDREIAIYMFEKISEQAKIISDREVERSKKVIGMKRIFSKGDIPKEWLGDDYFLDSFHKGFRETIGKFLVPETEEKTDFTSVETYIEDVSRGSRNSYVSPGSFDNWKWAEESGIKYALGIINRLNSPISKANTAQTLQTRAKPTQKGDVYFCIDISGSMRGSKLRQVKDGVIEYGNEATNNGHAVGIISFGSKANHILSPQLEINKRFVNSVNSLETSGYTNMAEAISTAMAYFKSKNIKRTIVIATDGEPCLDWGSGDEKAKTLAVANEAKRQGIEIMTIGCDGADEVFLKKLASRENLGQLVSSNDFQSGIKKMAGLLSA